MDLETLVAVRQGQFAWLSCIPDANLQDMKTTAMRYSLSEIIEIKYASCCNPCNVTPVACGVCATPGNQGDGSPPSQPGNPGGGASTNQTVTATLPQSCGNAKAWLCSTPVQAVMNAICAAIGALDPKTLPAAVGAVVSFLQFMCQLYKVACQDDSTAAVFLIGLKVLDNSVRTTLAGVSGPVGAVGILLNNLLTQMDGLAANGDTCLADVVSANPTVLQQLTQMIGG